MLTVPPATRSMFSSPSPPGVDALYVNTLKERPGEEPEEDEQEYGHGQERRRARNPFIDDECQVGHNDEDDMIEEASETTKFARGTLEDSQGNKLEPVVLAPPPPRSLSSYPPNADYKPGKRKKACEDANVKIDQFLAKRLKTKLCPVGDRTLAALALGETVVVEKTHMGRVKKVQEVKFNMHNLCMKVKEPVDPLVGPLGPGWVVRQASTLALLCPTRLRETFLLQRMMGHHVLRSERRRQAEVLELGPRLEEVARAMVVNTARCPAMLTDRRMTHNGLEVRTGWGSVTGHVLLLGWSVPQRRRSGSLQAGGRVS